MEFPKELPQVSTFPIYAPPKDALFCRKHGYILAQSLFQRELPGEDMVRDANYFLEHDVPKIIQSGHIEVETIAEQNNRVYSLYFRRSYVSSPFYVDQNGKHQKMDLDTCRKMRVPYNLGVWTDIEFTIKNYQIVRPLRHFTRNGEEMCFFAPSLYLESISANRGFVCSREVSKPASHIIENSLELEFEEGVLRNFHEDGARRQNANSANPVTTDRYIEQLWKGTTKTKFENQIYQEFQKHHPEYDSKYRVLVKNLVFIGKYDIETKKFKVQKMGKKSILKGKVSRTQPPFIEQDELLFINQSTEIIPNILLLQLPCMVGSSMCYTRKSPHSGFRFDSSIMHSGACERAMIRNMDLKADVCHIKEKSPSVFEGCIRSSHSERGSYRSTSSTILTIGTKLTLMFPFLKLLNDQPLPFHIVDFLKIMIDEPKTSQGEEPSVIQTMDQLLDYLVQYTHNPEEYRSILKDILSKDPNTHVYLKQPRSQVLKRIGHQGSRKAAAAAQQRQILHTIHTECLPHLNMPNTVLGRKFKVMHILREILYPTMDVMMGKSKPTDVHSIRSKQVNGFSNIIGTMFRQSFDRFKKAQMKTLRSKASGGVQIDNTIICWMFDHQRKFENMVAHSFNTGKVQPSQKKKGNKAKNEKPQIAIETILTSNMEGKLAILRRFHIAHTKKNYSAHQRMLHLSQYGFICPAETPEGEKCGLIMNFSLGVQTTVGYMSLQEAIQACRIILARLPNARIFKSPEDAMASLIDFKSTESILKINHVCVGVLDTSSLPNVLQELRDARACHVFHEEVSIYTQNSDLIIETQKGRLLRPLIRKEYIQNKLFENIFHECLDTNRPVWGMMIQKHIIEYYSPNEFESEIDPIIAAPTAKDFYDNPSKYSHVEVDPMFIFSNLAANSTNQAHNQCTRTSYACKHRTQAAAGGNLYTSSIPDNTKLRLDYPQRPIVDSATNHMTEFQEDFEVTTNVVVGIMTRKEANEDGVLINKASKERGLFQITKTLNFHAQEKQHHYIRVPPSGTRGLKSSNYSKLDPETGIVRVGEYIERNDVLAGIVFEDTSTKPSTWEDKSIIYSKQTKGRVINIETSETRFGLKAYTFTIQMMDVSTIQVGDKVASRHAQKGVITAERPAQDMPVVIGGPCHGMPLDMCFEIHGIPSRMTKGTLDETLLGNYGLQFGKQINGTVFENFNLNSKEECKDALGGDGKVQLLNPLTGEIYPEKVFVGVASYMRLNHLVAEKHHARNGGPVDEYRQAKAGKTNRGGLRTGEMERRTTEGHGAAEFTYERMFLMSDYSVAHICEECSSVNGDPPLPGHTRSLCRICNNPRSCVPVEMPYATIALLNYMQACGMPWNLDLVKDQDTTQTQETQETQQTKPTKRSIEETQESNTRKQQKTKEIKESRKRSSSLNSENTETTKKQKI